LRLEIRRLKELEVFNSLRLSVVVTTEVLTDVAADVTTDIAADVAAEAVAGRLGYRSRGLDTN
jgi:superfamily II DNA/RNA helicase